MTHTEFDMETSGLDITREVENILSVANHFFFLFLIDTDTGLRTIFEKTWLLWYEVFYKSRPDDFSIFDNEIEVNIYPLKIRFQGDRREPIFLDIIIELFLGSDHLNERFSHTFNALENEWEMLCGDGIIIHTWE
jgi:hypothetical protein